MTLQHLLPILNSLQGYRRATLLADLLAALIVTVILIPQSLAYALLAGLPAETGLYASILPLLVYALLGSSRTLSVGPMAVLALMTANAIGTAQLQLQAPPLMTATTLALLSGLFLLLMGIMRMGFFASFLSHPVISGFITASGLMIALSQIASLLGIQGGGSTVLEMAANLRAGLAGLNPYSLVLGGAALVFLLGCRWGLSGWLIRRQVTASTAHLLSKTAPIVAVVVLSLVTWVFSLDQRVAVVGAVPQSLPQLQWPHSSWSLIQHLWMPALMIAIIAYVESVSVGKTLAAKRQQKLNLNQEFIGLGSANIASAFSGGFPVTAGLSRSVANFEAGAVTQLAGIFTAVLVALSALFLTPLLYFLPKAVLAATIIVAVMGLLDFQILKKTFIYAKKDFAAVLITLLLTLLLGVEVGVASGVGASLLLHVYRTSRPHIAEVGLLEGTQHFRNIKHFKTQTLPQVLSLRMDAGLFFANVGALEDRIFSELDQRPGVKHVVLLFSGINDLDFSAAEVLQEINRRLQARGILLHLSEVKGPVQQRLQRSPLLDELTGQVFLTHYEAHRRLQRQESSQG